MDINLRATVDGEQVPFDILGSDMGRSHQCSRTRLSNKSDFSMSGNRYENTNNFRWCTFR
eukprot:scaffold1530_cov98-Cylindrotheca_fusiformis.AAC.2